MIRKNIGAAVLGLFIAAPLIAVLIHAERFTPSAPDIAALKFTLIQSLLSAAISVGIATFVARALARRRFWGRSAFITLLGAPFLLPALVAVLGLTTIYGRSGVINSILESLSLHPMPLYGMGGVVLAHVFLNLPLATRMLLNGWHAIPREHFALAESLDLTSGARFRYLEWPMLRAVAPGALSVIFALCLSSFAVALTLGGGPRATTIELAIWQAMRFDFDLGRAAFLSITQLILCGASGFMALYLSRQTHFGMERKSTVSCVTKARGVSLYIDFTAIFFTILLLVPPLAAVIWRGIYAFSDLPPSVWAAALRSLVIGLICGILTTSFALNLALVCAQSRATARWIEVVALLPIALSGLVLGTGIFLLIRPWSAPQTWANEVTLAVNCLLALPFCFRLLLPEAQSLVQDFSRLRASLGLEGTGALRWLILPRLARPLGFSAGVAAALSIGDLGVIALFAQHDNATLPLMLQRLMGVYKIDTAMAAALLLVLLSGGVFAVFDLWGRRYAQN